MQDDATEIQEINETLDTSTLTERQERVLAALLRYPTVRQAAKHAMVSEATVFRYKKDPAFAAVLREAQDARMSLAVAYLQAGAGDALHTLKAVMKDPRQKGQIRVSAASKWLTFALRTFYDLSELDLLLSRLRDEVDEYDDEG